MIAKYNGLEPRRCEDIENCGTRNKPEKFGDFGQTGGRLYRK